MSNKGYDMYFDVPIYSKNCIREMQEIHVEVTISPGLT